MRMAHIRHTHFITTLTKKNINLVDVLAFMDKRMYFADQMVGAQPLRVQYYAHK
jgi:hypothetical protein